MMPTLPQNLPVNDHTFQLPKHNLLGFTSFLTHLPSQMRCGSLMNTYKTKGAYYQGSGCTLKKAKPSAPMAKNVSSNCCILTWGAEIRAAQQIEAEMEYTTPEIRLVMAMGTLPLTRWGQKNTYPSPFAVTRP
jgi:hypothetical protein